MSDNYLEIDDAKYRLIYRFRGGSHIRSYWKSFDKLKDEVEKKLREFESSDSGEISIEVKEAE